MLLGTKKRNINMIICRDIPKNREVKSLSGNGINMIINILSIKNHVINRRIFGRKDSGHYVI